MTTDRRVTIIGLVKDKIARLEALISKARSLNIEVRREKLLREVGYRTRSGRCRVKGEDLIIIDRDAPLKDQIDFLAAELNAPLTEL